MKTNEVVTFGCRLNIYESEIIKDKLERSSLQNVTVINSCAVTKQAEKQACQTIRKIKRRNPSKKIIVTGCAAQNDPDVFASMKEVDQIIGNEEKLQDKYYNFDFDKKIVVNDIMSVTETANHMVNSFSDKARAFVQVQNGCNHRCTFCIIPFGRGNSRSVPIGVITEQLRALVDSGYKEVVFTGVDLTSYGADLPGSPSFAQMIKRVLNLVPDLPRLRLSSIDVAEIDDDLFDLMAYEERIMSHFHISLQSGDNMILKRMKRRHNRKQTVDFCAALRKIRPEVSFGADIIAGFPTETDEMFENTRKLISEASLQYLHVFPYSAREGTPAARMPQVQTKIKKERAAILREEGNKELQKFFRKNIGQQASLLVESNGFAHTENFIPVKLYNKFKAGQIISAELTIHSNDNSSSIEYMNAKAGLGKKMSNNTLSKLGVIGGGSWGTAIACLLSKFSDKVLLYANEKDTVEEINNYHTNNKYLQSTVLPEQIHATSNLKDLALCELIVVAVPSHAFSQALSELIKNSMAVDTTLLIATKGLTTDPVRFLSEEIEQHCTNQYAFISGPNFAKEVAEDKFTAITISSKEETLAKTLAKNFQHKNLDVSWCNDIVTIQIASIVKNIAAIKSGIMQAQGHGENAKAWLVSQALKEIAIISEIFGGKKDTLHMPAVVGDLVLTCYSQTSRNTKFGYEFHCNNYDKNFLNNYPDLVEGVSASRSLQKLLERHKNLDLPIIYSTASVCHLHRNQ